jgi:hypothetical protein
VDQIETEALARNDRYLREFVEALHLCPYALRCRETGKLHRRVVVPAEIAAALEAVRAVEALPAESVEVALLIFPTARADGLASARDFEAFCAEVRERMGRAHHGDPPFYCVAFHPDLPRDLHDAHRAVQFIRRSPDPTLQLVRAAVLRQVRGTGDGTRVVDPSAMTLEQLLAISAPLSLSDRIAEANLATLNREGPDHLEALLAGFRGHET